MANHEEQRKKYAELIAKAWSDESFKQKLIANPKEALKEMGVQVPSGPLKVCDGTDGTFFLVIPKKPEKGLSEDELRRMSGGHGIGWDPLSAYVCVA